VKARGWLIIVLILDAVIVTGVAVYWLHKSFAKKPDEASSSAGTLKVQLYYYNRTKDTDATGNLRCSPDAVLPVEREIPRTRTPIADTIRLLIAGRLTDAERAAGFSTEFPHPQFTLLRANLKDGVLTLTFPEIPSFTMGGAARVTLLAAQIEKTARQFPGVEEVRFDPESLFQP
jgi:spore germination protein GerM